MTGSVRGFNKKNVAGTFQLGDVLVIFTSPEENIIYYVNEIFYNFNHIMN